MAAKKTTSFMAIISLVLGVVSLLCSFLTGIPGIICGILALNEIGKSNGKVGGRGMAMTGIILSSILSFVALLGILVGMMLPAVQAVREAARRTESMNNLRQIQIAQLNHESLHGSFPGLGVNSDQPGSGLSWRVHLLPQINHVALYEKFNLDEPWDSPTNKALIPLMPEVYQSLGGSDNSSLPPGHTQYLRPIKNGAFPDPAIEPYQPTTIASIMDGTANTISVIEVDVNHARIWTKPDADFEFDPNDPLAGVGDHRPGGFLVVYADGSTEFISNRRIAPISFSALLTHQGND